MAGATWPGYQHASVYNHHHQTDACVSPACVYTALQPRWVELASHAHLPARAGATGSRDLETEEQEVTGLKGGEELRCYSHLLLATFKSSMCLPSEGTNNAG